MDSQNLVSNQNATAVADGQGQAQAQSPNIFDEIGLTNLNSEQRESLLKDFMSAIQAAINTRIINGMDEPILQEFDKLCEAGDQEKINEFLKAKVSNIDKITAEETQRFRDNLKQEMEQVAKNTLPPTTTN